MTTALFKKLNISKKSIITTLIIAWPAVVESFFMAITNLVDSFMVSTISEYSVAAVGITAQPKLLGLALFFALGVSSSAIIARRLGENRKDDANRVMLTAVSIAVVASILISILFTTFASQIMEFCGTTETTHEDAVVYFKIIMGGIFFNCIQITINSCKRGAGNTRITMITNVTSNLVNIALNYVLIGGHLGFPKLGVKGAAIATVIGAFFGCLISILSLFKKDCFLNAVYVIKQKLTPTIQSLKLLTRFGYSVLIEQVLFRVGFLATAIMAANLGDDPMAAHQVAMNIITLSFAFGDGLQAAAVALIGRSLGEKNPDKAKEYGRTCQFLGAIISLVLAILFLTLGKWIMCLFFPNSPQIVDIGVQLVRLIIFIVLFQIVQVVFMGCLRGAGDTLYTAVVSMVSVVIIRTVVSYLFGYVFAWGILGVWLGIFADQFTRFICSAIRFVRGKWVHIKV